MFGRTPISPEEHEGLCGCGATVREEHTYGTVVENDSFKLVCGMCGGERTISVNEVVRSSAKLSVAVTAEDGHEVPRPSYQWLKETNHTSGILGLALSLLCLLTFGPSDFIIPSMLAILAVLTLLRKPLEKGGDPQ